MSNKSENFIEEVGNIAKKLDALGFDPVLVGGMALAMHGSERVTYDFDFVVNSLDDHIKELIGVFYDSGLELASRLDQQGKITATIDNRRVAAARLSLDQPTSVYFTNPKTGLRVDVLFDFPVPARELVVNADKIKVASHVLYVACVKDLLRLKEIAAAERSKSGDSEDLDFLKRKSKNPKIF